MERNPKARLLLRARVVVPVSRPPIADGAVLVAGERIAALGRWRDLRGETSGQSLDLGDQALLPGLVNAHCHLDYTNMAGQLPPPNIFTDWLKAITEMKAGWGFSDYAGSWLNGARMLLRTGTTTVGDIEAVPELLPDIWGSTPLRVLSFLEMIGITHRRLPADILQEAVKRILSLGGPRRPLGLSPHAPYSTLPELLRLSGITARKRRWPVCIHVAESELEFEMFAHGRGHMFEWLKGSQRNMSDCGQRSPVQHLEWCRLLGKNLLAAHVNYLANQDAALLGRRGVSVVHCPRSHFYFRHGPFPLRQLRRAGVNICLGTDSLVSVYKTRRQNVELSVFEEMRALAERETSLAPKEIFAMATVNGARALGLQGRVGELAPRAFADLIALPYSGRPRQVYEAALQHSGGVAASMIGGKWAVAPAMAA